MEVGFIYDAGREKVEERIEIHLVILWLDVFHLVIIGC